MDIFSPQSLSLLSLFHILLALSELFRCVCNSIHFHSTDRSLTLLQSLVSIHWQAEYASPYDMLLMMMMVMTIPVKGRVTLRSIF